MKTHLRVARPASDLSRSARMYTEGLAMLELGSFTDHKGFDGVMLGDPENRFHLEFTHCRHHTVPPSPTPEDLLVFYVPDIEQWQTRCSAMRTAGFIDVEPFNPYWAQLGCTFRDHDGYTTVIQQAEWNNAP